MRVVCADVMDWAREYDGPPFHALLCDPSYALSKKKVLDMNAKIEDEIETIGDLIAAYHSIQQWGDTGFMSRAWDTDVAFDPRTWAALAEHLHPGGFVMAFASSRGWHRLACAMEDAGLVIQPSIFVWLNAQAFPKASRIDTAIDKAAGKLEEREVIGPNPHARPIDGQGGGYSGPTSHEPFLTAPATPLVRAWEGHRYGGQVLKNCAEPVIVAQKPWTKPRLDCIVRTGAGSLWVDGGRVAGPKPHHDDAGRPSSKSSLVGEGPPTHAHSQGRWPANFALCHSPGCVRAGVRRVKVAWSQPVHSAVEKGTLYELGYAGKDSHIGKKVGYADPDGLETVPAWRCEEGCVVDKLGEMSGESKSSTNPDRFKGTKKFSGKHYASDKYTLEMESNKAAIYADKGTAARFYQQCGWEHEVAECAAECPVAKLDEQAGERKTHPGTARSVHGAGSFGIETQPGRVLSEGNSGGASRFYAQADWSHEIAERLATSDPVRYCPKAAKRERQSGLDDFFWKKDKASPTGFMRITREEWEALGEEEERIKEETGKRVSLRARGNIHPTQKPISLNKWLATLLLPPKEYAPRRILVPFAGMMSEAVGAALVGWEEVVAVEMIRDYCDAGEARLEFWAGQPKQLELV